MRRYGTLTITSLLVLLLPQPAAAGGWWTTADVHDKPLAVGESLSVKVGEVLFRTIEDAQEAETTPYFAYLVTAYDEALLHRALSRDDPKRWWEPLSPPIRIGVVTFSGRDANLQRGRVHVDVPEIAPGSYFFMLCDAGCQMPLGNHIPVPVQITTDVVAAQTARRLERMGDRLDERFARVREDVREAMSGAREARQDSRDAMRAGAEFATRLAAQPAAATSNPLLTWLSYAGWFVAGGCAALLIRRRSSSDATTPDPIIERIPDDARELTDAPV